MLATSEPVDLAEMAMPASRNSPSVKRRHLSRKLRELREDRGLTAESVTKALEWSTGKLSGMENNKWKRPDPRDVKDLCDLYKASDAIRDDLMRMARESRQRGWWEEQYSDVSGSAYVGFEQEARVTRSFQPLVIPGLLQTPTYMRALIRADLIRGEEEIERRIQMRLKRQQILTHEDPLQLWVVIDEAALRRPFGTSAEHREQLQQLIDTDELQNVTVQVLPFEAGLHAGLACGFVILTYEDDPSIVVIETGDNALYLEKEEDLARHTLRFQHLQASALSPVASVEFMRDMMSTLK